MNENNLIPEAHKLTVEDQSKGGKASGKARRYKKALKQVMETVLYCSADTISDGEILADIGINTAETEDISNMLVICASLVKNAKYGDVGSAKLIWQIMQDEITQKTKLEKERFKLEKEKFEYAKNGNNTTKIPENNLFEKLVENTEDFNISAIDELN